MEFDKTLLRIFAFLLLGSAGLLANQTSIIVTKHGNKEGAQTHAYDHEAPYFRLQLTNTDQKNITELISTIADCGYLQLLKKKKKLSELGEIIRPVHPLRFIGYIYSKPTLKKKMLNIIKDPLRQKRKGFFHGSGKSGGFSNRMNIEKRNNNINVFIPGFCATTGISEAVVKKYTNSSQWEGLLDYLFS